MKIKVNRIQCKLCGDIIESKNRRDMVWCSCGACGAEGGTDYKRRLGKDYIELIEYIEAEDKKEIYENELKAIMVHKAEMQTAKINGRKEGLEEGIKEGLEKAIRNLKDVLDIKTLAEKFELTIEEVEKIRKKE